MALVALLGLRTLLQRSLSYRLLSQIRAGERNAAPGGAYVFITQAFGPAAGSVMGTGLWLSLVLKSACAGWFGGVSRAGQRS